MQLTHAFRRLFKNEGIKKAPGINRKLFYKITFPAAVVLRIKNFWDKH